MLPERTREAIICGKWNINFLQHEPGRGGSTFSKSYLDEIDDHLSDASANATAMRFLLQGLPTKLEVVEFFGGAGIQSTIIQQTLQPSKHMIIENDYGCIAQLKQLFDSTPNVVVLQADARQLIEYMPADLFVLDWNSWTIQHWGEWRRPWSRLMERNPMAGVIWFDSSWSYFHMNREGYGQILRRKLTTREDYTRALSNFFNQRFGYLINRTAYCPRGTYYLMRPAGIVSDQFDGQAIVEMKAYPNSGGFVWKPV